MATKAQVDAFINRMAPIAMRQAKKHGNKIFASVCIAQACVESSYGTTQKMIKANAVYGIKVGKSAYHFGTAWKDLSYNTKTKEVRKGKYEEIRDDFRAYASLEDATEDYFDLLCTASRYKKALNAKDYKACIKAIAPSYATAEQDNCKYSKTVISIIEKYDLTKYDSGEASPDPADMGLCPYEYPADTIKYDMKGNDVKWLQWQLCRHGFALKIDGIYGPKTRAAVIKFQKDYVVPQAIVGPLTKEALKA